VPTNLFQQFFKLWGPHLHQRVNGGHRLCVMHGGRWFLSVYFLDIADPAGYLLRVFVSVLDVSDCHRLNHSTTMPRKQNQMRKFVQAHPCTVF